MVRTDVKTVGQGYSRRAVLRRIGTGALAAALSGCALEPGTGTAADNVMPLRAAAKAGRRKFGAAVSSELLGKDAGYRDLIRRECSIIVPEWEMKWYNIQKDPDRYDFSGCDKLAAFASENGMELRGHTLVWHLGLPDWAKQRLRDRQGKQVLQTWMNMLMTRYSGIVQSWDVVNEAVEPTDDRPDMLRESDWLAAFGPGYISDAFKMAAEIAPKAQLVYNDYGTEHNARWSRDRRVAILRLLERVKGEGGRIDALGLQSHLRLGDPWDPKAFGAFLREVETMGIKPIITEMDVRADRVTGDAEVIDAKVADLYTSYLETVFANSRCDTVVTWGLTDRYTFQRRRHADDRPLPYDENLHPKKAAAAVARILRDEG
ncbi:MAG TPA: endo-1,4-beta-xylanase [Skermanella sp.]|jgi:endo-1,4-beta-xylanase|nr:endo-1,4-beta-xylanase [Skermanella sp.]